MIEYRFRVSSAAVFTLYSYSKDLEYRFRIPTAGSLNCQEVQVWQLAIRSGNSALLMMALTLLRPVYTRRAWCHTQAT
jgi:hypothetical protein